MYNLAKRVRFSIAASALSLILTGCFDSGPSKTDAEKVLSAEVAEATRFMGGLMGNNSANQTQIPVVIRDIKCNKTGNGAYDCDLLADIQGNQIPARYRFVKLGDKWTGKELK